MDKPWSPGALESAPGYVSTRMALRGNNGPNMNFKTAKEKIIRGYEIKTKVGGSRMRREMQKCRSAEKREFGWGEGERNFERGGDMSPLWGFCWFFFMRIFFPPMSQMFRI